MAIAGLNATNEFHSMPMFETTFATGTRVQDKQHHKSNSNNSICPSTTIPAPPCSAAPPKIIKLFETISAGRIRCVIHSKFKQSVHSFPTLYHDHDHDLVLALLMQVHVHLKTPRTPHSYPQSVDNRRPSISTAVHGVCLLFGPSVWSKQQRGRTVPLVTGGWQQAVAAGCFFSLAS